MEAVRFGKNQLRIVIICVLALTTLVALLNINNIHRQLDEWKLLPQPERLTELYYENHAKLSTTYTAGAPQQFTFITHNLEYQETDYTYTVVQKSEDGKTTQPLVKGKFTLAPDRIGTTPITFTPVELSKRSQIATTLTNETTGDTQSIHYWVTTTTQTSNITEPATEPEVPPPANGGGI